MMKKVSFESRKKLFCTDGRLTGFTACDVKVFHCHRRLRDSLRQDSRGSCPVVAAKAAAGRDSKAGLAPRRRPIQPGSFSAVVAAAGVEPGPPEGPDIRGGRWLMRQRNFPERQWRPFFSGWRPRWAWRRRTSATEACGGPTAAAAVAAAVDKVDKGSG